MNEKAIRVLELDKILDRLAGYTTFSAGADLARELYPDRPIWKKRASGSRKPPKRG